VPLLLEEGTGARLTPFDGCFAVTCRDEGGHGCGANFCGWCFAHFPAGRAGDAMCHAHVVNCASNTAPGRDLFGGPNPEALFAASLREHRQRMLDKLLDGLPEALCAPLVASLQPELAAACLVAGAGACARLPPPDAAEAAAMAVAVAAAAREAAARQVAAREAAAREAAARQAAAAVAAAREAEARQAAARQAAVVHAAREREEREEREARIRQQQSMSKLLRGMRKLGDQMQRDFERL
jgi:hypothetical protein